MLEAKRRKLKKTIIIKALVTTGLLILNIITGMKVNTKFSERSIYESLVFEYSNLEFDKKLSRIAETCAKQCYTEGIDAKGVHILENEEFVYNYSVDCHVTKYTESAKSNDAFIESFFAEMKTEKRSETNSRLKKCQYVGIGKYKTQIFILAFYTD